MDDPAAVESSKNIKPVAGSPDTNFRAIAEYLCGEETVDYIKLIKLTAPGWLIEMAMADFGRCECES